MKLIDPERTYPYVLEEDWGKEGVPIFHIRPLSYRDSQMLLSDSEQFVFTQGGKITSGDKGEAKEKMFLRNVVKIENVVWPGTSEPVTVESEAEKKRLFACLSIADGQELIIAIQNLSRLEEAEAKN